MLKALEDITATKKRLKIEIPAQTVESEIQKALNDVQRKSKLPGFRPGKAPMSLVEKKYGKDVEADVLEKLIPDAYEKALKEAVITPVSRPVMEESFDFKRNEPLSMTVTVEVRPKIENLAYEGIAVKEVPVELTEEEIDKVLENLAEERATYESVEDAVAAGDLLTIDYTVQEDGTAGKDVVLKVGSGPYPQEFFDELIGRKKNEEVQVSASFPEDMQSQFAGKKLSFNVTVKEIKRRNIPPFDDEFAKDLDFENIGLLRDKIKENILASKNRSAEGVKQRGILDKLIESHNFEVPESLLSDHIEGSLGEIRASGKDERTDEAIREEIKPHAEKSVKASILLELIGEKEGITVTEEDAKEEVLNIAQKFYVSPENVIKYYVSRDGSLEGLKKSVFEKKVLNFLLSKAIIEKGE